MANEVYVVVRQKPTALFRQAMRDNPNFLKNMRAKTQPVLEKAGGERVVGLGMHSDGGLFVYKFPDLDAWRSYNMAWSETVGISHSEYFSRTVEFGFLRE